jgi:hypothetical protein
MGYLCRRIGSLGVHVLGGRKDRVLVFDLITYIRAIHFKAITAARTNLAN